jgi:hypothetical protein
MESKDTIMKFFLTLLVFYITSINSHGQIPNGNFENWTQDGLTGWTTSNANFTYTIFKVYSAYSGSFAVRGEVIGGAIPFIYAGSQEDPGFICTTKPLALEGYFKFYPEISGSDYLEISLSFYKDTRLVASEVFENFALNRDYIQFSLNTNLSNDSIPDKCQIKVTVKSKYDPKPAAGTWFQIDNLEFTYGAADAHEEILTNSFLLNQNYPNPFNSSTVIKYTIPEQSSVLLKIYDLQGTEIENIVDEIQKAGTYQKTWNAEALPSGVYFYNLRAGSYSETKKFILIR